MEQNYFTEIEEYLRAKRGTPMYRLSVKEFALADKWEKAGIPLATVLRGIDLAFEDFWRAHPGGGNINGLRYCESAIMELWRRSAQQPTVAPPVVVSLEQQALEREWQAIPEKDWRVMQAAGIAIDWGSPHGMLAQWKAWKQEAQGGLQ